MVLLPELEHAPDSFLPPARGQGSAMNCFLKGGFLGERQEILLQGDSAGLSPRKESSLDFRLQVKCNRHRARSLSVYVSFTALKPAGGSPKRTLSTAIFQREIDGSLPPTARP
jgi:hypothetical protein